MMLSITSLYLRDQFFRGLEGHHEVQRVKQGTGVCKTSALSLLLSLVLYDFFGDLAIQVFYLGCLGFK